MPHGGGHVGGFSGGGCSGGGGFGGGGFGGGGWGHHHGWGHRHHHRHHPRHFGGPGWTYWWMPTYYYYGSPGYAYRRAYICACAWFWIFLVCLLLIIILPAVIGTSGDYQRYAYAPGDTRIVSGISESLCNGISLTDRSTYTPTLYSLKRNPRLNSTSFFTVPSHPIKTVDGKDGYVYWSYYLHEGSRFSVTTCLLFSRSRFSSLRLLLIKGRRNFNSWTNNGRANRVFTTTFISANCPSTSSPISYTVPPGHEDDWYIVVYNSGSSSLPRTFQITISVNRTEYTIVPSDVRQECTPSGTSPCSIPITGGDTYLVRIDPGSSPNYEDNVDICLNCVVNGGVIAAIVIVPTLFFVGLIVVVVAICCFVRRNEKASTTPASTDTTTTTTAMTVNAQPPVNAQPTDPTQPPVNPSVPPPYTSFSDMPQSYEMAQKQ